jgi:hypothetical protein
MIIFILTINEYNYCPSGNKTQVKFIQVDHWQACYSKYQSKCTLNTKGQIWCKDLACFKMIICKLKCTENKI